MNLDNEIDQMNSNCEEQSLFTSELYKLRKDIQTIDLEIVSHLFTSVPQNYCELI